MYKHSEITSATMLPVAGETAEWFAIHIRARHEKKVAAELQQRGITSFLPLLAKVHNWSDRRKMVELPLFSCYAFVQIVRDPKMRLSVLTTQGVLGFVGANGQGTPIPTSQIEDLRTIMLNRIPVYPQDFLKIGQRVRIRGGALNGIEGILVRTKGDRQLVLSIETIQRSISLSVEGYDIEPL